MAFILCQIFHNQYVEQFPKVILTTTVCAYRVGQRGHRLNKGKRVYF